MNKNCRHTQLINVNPTKLHQFLNYHVSIIRNIHIIQDNNNFNILANTKGDNITDIYLPSNGNLDEQGYDEVDGFIENVENSMNATQNNLLKQAFNSEDQSNGLNPDFINMDIDMAVPEGT